MEPEPERQFPNWEAHFARKLQDWRRNAGLSLNKLAQLLTDSGLPTHAQQIARIESGERAVRLNEAALIANLFGRSLDEVIHVGIATPRYPAFARRTVADSLSRAKKIAFRLRNELELLVGDDEAVREVVATVQPRLAIYGREGAELLEACAELAAVNAVLTEAIEEAALRSESAIEAALAGSTKLHSWDRGE